MMSFGAGLFLAFLVVQRLSELVIARRNTARLMAAGAQEVAPGHYPLIVALHTAWIASLIVFGYGAALHPVWLGLFALLQVLRVWILATLGARWTTRIIVTQTPLVVAGPYRWVRHPNYLLVIAEIFVAPMVLGLWQVALIFSVLNALVLSIRIRAENAALRPLGGAAPN